MKNKELYAYIAFLWHGFFLAITMAMLDLNTVFPILINTLSENKYVFGALYSIMLGAPLLFNVIFSHHIRRFVYKKKFLLIGMYVRGLSFLGMSLFVYYFGLDNPRLVIGSLFFFVFLFSVSGGVAGLSYSDLIAKTTKSENRATFFSVKQLISSVAGLLGGFIVARIFSDAIVFPDNYATSLAIGFVGLFVASIFFIFLKEPYEPIDEVKTSLKDYIKSIPSVLKTDQSFSFFILVENLSSFSIMVLPFYIIYANQVFDIEPSFIGTFLIIQITGTIFSNVVWGLLGKYFKSKSVVRFCILLGGLNPIIAIVLGATNPYLYGIVFFILGFTISGRRVGFEPFLLDITPRDRRIEYLGIRGSLNIMIVVLPLIGALLRELIGFEITFIIVSITMIIAFILLRKVDAKEFDMPCDPI
jgi:MFS family permease